MAVRARARLSMVRGETSPSTTASPSTVAADLNRPRADRPGPAPNAAPHRADAFTAASAAAITRAGEAASASETV
jgi:hypothetical protein